MPAHFSQKKADLSTKIWKNQRAVCSYCIRRVRPLHMALDGAILLTRAAKRCRFPLSPYLLTDGYLQWRSFLPAANFAASDAFLRSQCRSRGVCPHFFFTAACPRRGAVGQRLHRINRPYILIQVYYKGTEGVKSTPARLFSTVVAGGANRALPVAEEAR